MLKEKPHPRFTRSKNDLCLTANITLLEALTGVSLDVATLDSRTLSISISDVVKPGMQKVIVGEGMPLVSKPSQTGNLVISFNITFPEALTEAQKILLKENL
jgi:DnaJ family protein B protein 4